MPGNRGAPIVLIFVTRRSSGVGRRMESVLARLQLRLRDELRVERVEADEQPALLERLGVSEVPALVMVEGMQPVAWLPGRATGAEIEAAIAARRRARAGGDKDAA